MTCHCPMLMLLANLFWLGTVCCHWRTLTSLLLFCWVFCTVWLVFLSFVLQVQINNNDNNNFLWLGKIALIMTVKTGHINSLQCKQSSNKLCSSLVVRSWPSYIATCFKHRLKRLLSVYSVVLQYFYMCRTHVSACLPPSLCPINTFLLLLA